MEWKIVLIVLVSSLYSQGCAVLFLEEGSSAAGGIVFLILGVLVFAVAKKFGKWGFPSWAEYVGRLAAILLLIG